MDPGPDGRSAQPATRHDRGMTTITSPVQLAERYAATETSPAPAPSSSRLVTGDGPALLRVLRAPPANNVLTRDLLTVVVFTLFLVFSVGLRRLLGRRAGLAGDIALASGLVYVATTLVAASLETGVALEYPDGSTPPSTDPGQRHGAAARPGRPS